MIESTEERLFKDALRNAKITQAGWKDSQFYHHSIQDTLIHVQEAA